MSAFAEGFLRPFRALVPETRQAARPEERSAAVSVQALTYGWNDPSAIPPPGLMAMQRAGVLVTEDTMLQVDVVFTAMRIITTAILMMGNPRAHTMELTKDNQPWRKYLGDQPKLLTDTWGGMFQYDGMRRSLMSMGLLGECFWYTLDYDKLAYPEALEVLHPAFMELKKEGSGPIEYWYGTAAEKKRLDPDRVTHIPYMAMPQAFRGLNPVKYAGVSGALAMAAYEFGSTWFSQGASPSFLLSTDKKLGTEEINRIAAKFMVEHSGLSKSHLPLVLDNGLNAEKVLSNPDEAQFLQTLEYARSVLSIWFGIPVTMMPNALERQAPPGTHTSQEEITRFNTFTLSGYTIPIAEALSRMLPEAQKCVFISEALEKPDAQFQAQKIMALRNAGVASKNEIRTRELNLPPVDDPDADDLSAPLASNVKPGGDNTGPGEKDTQPQQEQKSRERRSKAPDPPNYRPCENDDERCGVCRMNDDGVCWGYGNKEIDLRYLCDSFEEE